MVPLYLCIAETLRVRGSGLSRDYLGTSLFWTFKPKEPTVYHYSDKDSRFSRLSHFADDLSPFVDAYEHALLAQYPTTRYYFHFYSYEIRNLDTG